MNRESSDMIGLFARKASESANNSSQGEFDLTAEEAYIFLIITPRSTRRKASGGVISLWRGVYRAS